MSLSIRGKFFLKEDSYHFLKAVTYGPFPPNSPHSPAQDFPKISSAGFNAIRTYALPSRELLDEAHRHDLHLIPTLPWAHGCDFMADPSIFDQALEKLTSFLRQLGTHPALGAILIGNEIPSDMARWMGPEKVRAALDSLILAGKRITPDLPFAYSSFPTTEYLEPDHADFSAFNLYLENSDKLAAYHPRLHHLAGDRPVLLTEFGLDTQRNSEAHQAELLPAALTTTHLAGLAGFTAYAWSDHWFNNAETVTDWSFGLIRRDLSVKPVLPALEKTLKAISAPPQLKTPPRISVIICTRNGAERLPSCLQAVLQLDYPNFEILIINDGSTDGTQKLLDQTEGISTFHLPPSGLSAARNFGAENASGDIFAFTDDDCQVDPHWLTWLALTFAKTEYAAIGGPNLPPPTTSARIAVTATAPGAPTHVMLTDTEAEHLPGCNIAIRRQPYQEVEGFDAIFHTAGDDVDLCWRLRDAGYTLGFCGAAFVWHDRRPTPWRYLKQQINYGHAEALLYQKHPEKFAPGGRGGIRWEGCVYTGGALGIHHGDTIYSGPTGQAPYQSLIPRVQPTRPLSPAFDKPKNQILLKTLTWLQQHLRPWSRHRHGGPPRLIHRPNEPRPPLAHQHLTFTHHQGQGREALYEALLSHGWLPAGPSEFDLTKDGSLLFAATEQSGSRTARTFLRLHITASGIDPRTEIRHIARALGFDTSSSSPTS